jgi:hypothetical protein
VSWRRVSGACFFCSLALLVRATAADPAVNGQASVSAQLPSPPPGPARQTTRRFDFRRDTLTFANWTVWNYQGGRHVIETRDHREKSDRYTRRCFVMSRTVEQFYKFARFDPKTAPLDDHELARRVRAVTRRAPWHAALPPDERILFPGFANLRQLSGARTHVLQENIGLGWPTYLRIGNFRMFYLRGWAYQDKTHTRLNAALDRDQMFAAYLSDYPILHINHAVLIYERAGQAGEGEGYVCYDPNHPEAPRTLTWLPGKRQFNYEKDQEFAGGYTRVYEIYGKPLQ